MNRTLCEGVIVNEETGAASVCGAAAATTVVSGCIHEHVTESLACSLHLRILRTGHAFCRLCHQGPDSHRCTLLGREVAA